MLITLYIFTAAILSATLLPLSSNPRWWIRGFDFPRLQFFTVTLIFICVFISCIFIFNPNHLAPYIVSIIVCLTILVSCCIYQGFWIYPHTRFSPPEVASITAPDSNARTFSLITANVLTPNRDAPKLLSLIKKHDPDVVLTLESDKWWETQLDEIEADYPHTVKCPLDNLYGIHLYSKLELSETHLEFLVEDDVPSIHSLIKLRCGDLIRAHFLHPAPPSPTENEESSERDAELLVVAKSIRKSSHPTLVSGDMNDVAWSRTTRLFRKVSRLLDPRVGRGMFNTFHADYRLLRWPLDHLFISPHFSLIDIKRLEHFGSDHFALYSNFYLNEKKQSAQVNVEVNNVEKKQAEKIIERQKVGKKDVPLDEK